MELKDLNSKTTGFYESSKKLISELKQILYAHKFLLGNEIFNEIKEFSQNFFIIENDKSEHTDKLTDQIQKIYEKIKKNLKSEY